MPLHIDIDALDGLSTREALKRLKQDGYNELPQSKQRSIFSIVIGVVREPMFLLLVGAGLIYFFIGDIQEGLMLLSFVIVIIGIAVYQERKTENALEALRSLSSPRALVIRDHIRRRISGREVVRGDLTLLTEGDRVPADSRILESLNLMVDESILTGESVPVRKFARNEDQTTVYRPGGEDQPIVYSGTLVVQGIGVAEVVATGSRTEMGKIGKTLGNVRKEETQLKLETDRLVRQVAIIGLLVCVLTVALYGITRFNWIRGLLAGITLAMAILPEEFPVVLTVFLALGAWRISKHQVLTRDVTAIETLGAATVLCVDKTGTLTENKMTVVSLFADGKYCNLQDLHSSPMPEYCHELMEFAILASKRNPFDPMEKALHQLGKENLTGTEHLHDKWELVDEYPLSKQLLAMSNVWRSPGGDEFIIAAKGAPEAISDLCHLKEPAVQEISHQVSTLADDSLRVIGIAKAYFRKGDLPDGQHDFTFKFLGLVGFLDPVRQGVPAAIRECHSAGIRVIMITGDYPKTAMKIARQIGLDKEEQYLTGLDLEALSDDALKSQIERVSVFARAVPEQKMKIVNALKAKGHIVAMTGDGVNDAPSLKAADIGIAMGERGTDVARETSSLVLLDDDFSSIVTAVRMGRRIFDNIRKAVAYILAIHVPIAGMSLLPILFGWPLVLLPVHIVFLELIIDPACSIVFEAEEAESDVMKKPPRKRNEPLFDRTTISFSLIQGGVILLALLAVFSSGYSQGLAEGEVRAFTFTTIVIANLSLIFIDRSWSSTMFETIRRPNPALWWVIGGSVFFLGLILYHPYLRALFNFAPITHTDLLLALVVGVLSVMWFEIIKVVKKKKEVHHSD